MTSFVGSLLLPAAIKGSAILAVAAITTLALRRASAATKHLVWTVALAGVLLVPLLGAALPSVPLPITVPSVPGRTAHVQPAEARVVTHTLVTSHSTAPTSGAENVSQAASAALASAPASAASHRAATVTASPPVEGADVRTVLVELWAAGAVVLLTHLFIGLWNASRLVRRSRPVDDDTWQGRLECALDQVGFRRGVILLVSSDTAVPITCGIRRPVIVLPADAFTWPDERAKVVLLHEAAHIKRHDCLVQYLAQVTRALHWFNPLAWIATARLTAERERACDDLVLAAGTRGSSYAEHLLEIARSLRGRHAPVAALAMARPSELEGRLLSILDAARPHRLPTRRGLMAIVGVAAVGVVGMAAIRMEPRVEARAHPVPADVAQVVAQGLPTPTPTPTPAAVPMPAPIPSPRVNPAPQGKAERQAKQAREGVTREAEDDDAADDNPEESKVDAAARDAIAQALVAALKDEDAEVRRSAMASLMRVRSPLALEPMVGALRDTDVDIREHAAFALGQLRDQRAVPALTAALQDQSAEVREKVVFALGQLRAESAAEAVRQALKDAVPSIRSQAAFALGQIRSRTAVPDLIAALKDANGDVRKQAAFALGQIGDPGAVDALTAALKDVDTEVRRTVAFALGQVTR